MTDPTTAYAGPPEPTLTLDALLATMERLNSLPEGDWLLIAPDGRVWRDKDVDAIVRAAAMEAFATRRLFPIPPGAPHD